MASSRPSARGESRPMTGTSETMTATRTTSLDLLQVGIVDDNAYFRRITRTMLTGFGVRRVLEAATVTDGWSLVVDGKPDIVMIDWQLGEGTGGGLGLLDRIRTSADDFVATQAVVIVSAYSARRHVMAAIQRGANDFVVKPVSARQLYDRLVRVVRGSGRYVRTNGRLVPVPRSATAPVPAPPVAARAQPAPVPAAAPAPVDDDVLYI
jgi:DNA-binding response OmpR family regulator